METEGGAENVAPPPVEPKEAAKHTVRDWPLEDHSRSAEQNRPAVGEAIKQREFVDMKDPVAPADAKEEDQTMARVDKDETAAKDTGYLSGS